MLKTIAQLRHQYSAADGDMIEVNGVWYKYSATSTAADNGTTVVRPKYKTAGRWLRATDYKHFLKSDNTETATLTVAQVLGGIVATTSAAATTLTLPAAADVAAAIPDLAAGASFDLIIDNSQGANTVTLAVATGFTVSTPAITGGDTLTVSKANAVGLFRFFFTSTTAAKIYRIF